MKASNVRDLRSPTANMYGFEPCPQCKGVYRCAFMDKPEIIQCDGCGFQEPYVEVPA